MTDAKSMLEILFESIWEQVKEYNYRRGEMKEQRAPGNDRCFKGVIGIQTKIKIDPGQQRIAELPWEQPMNIACAKKTVCGFLGQRKQQG